MSTTGTADATAAGPLNDAIPAAAREEPRSPDDAASLPWPNPGVGWYAVFVLTVAYVLAFVDRTILSLMVGPIRADLGLSDTQISLLHGFAFALFFTLIGIPISLLADRLNRRNIVALGIAAWSAATVLCGVAKSFWGLFAARVGVGVGEAALTPSAYSMVADLFPPSQLARALAVFTVGLFAGVGFAYMIGGAVVGSVSDVQNVVLPLVGELRPWQFAFVVVGLPGIPIALWMLTVREPVRRRPPSTGSLRAAFADCLGYMRVHWQVYVAHCVGFSLLALLFNATGAWLPAYLMRVHALAPGETGFWLGLIMLVTGVGGVLGGGWLGDRLTARGRTDGNMRVGIVAALGALPLAATATTVEPLWLSLVLVAVYMFFLSLPYGAAAAAIQIVTPGRMRATASAIYLCLVNLIGLGMGPTLVALATDHVFADDRAVGKSLALVSTLCAPLAAVLLAWGLPHFRRTAAALRTTGDR
jgi:MFS family permease